MSLEEASPQLSALFVVRFDQRIGYTLSWSKATPDCEILAPIGPPQTRPRANHAAKVDLTGVEFKSLPSGLHNVKDDLVYFLQADTHAGLSAFRNDDASAADRNASFACVGALVPLQGSRLGRIWLHAPELRRMAGLIQGDADKTAQLDRYWEEHKMPEQTNEGDKPPQQPQSKRQEKAQSRPRALSESTNLTATAPSSFHPAHSISDLFDAFGPLLFPLYRAALLRKRILLIKKPSVQRSCDFIYILSILSSIPNDALDAILANAPTRSTPKFSVGITEIPELEKVTTSTQTRKPQDDPDAGAVTDDGERFDDDGGWLACTTDELLAMKSQLYDLKIEFPGIGAMATPNQQHRSWPSIIESASASPAAASQSISPETIIRASPRDARRYKALRQGLRQMTRFQRYTDPDDDAEDDVHDEEDEHLLRPETDEIEHDDRSMHHHDANEPIAAEREAVEPPPWAAIAYDSFVWWASAGERSVEVDEETMHYRELLSSAVADSVHADDESNKTAAIVVGYFHQWTSLILSTLADLVEEAESSASPSAQDTEDESVVVKIGKDELMTMGLDAWSKNDRQFVRELCQLYFGVDASVDGRSVECCGVRVL